MLEVFAISPYFSHIFGEPQIRLWFWSAVQPFLGWSWELCEAGHRVIPSWSLCKKGHVDGPCCGAWSWSPSHGWFYTKDSSYNCGFFCFVGTLVPQFHTLKGESLGTPFVWWKTQSFPAPKAWPSHLRCPEPARGAEVRKGRAHFWRCHGQKVFVNIC